MTTSLIGVQIEMISEYPLTQRSAVVLGTLAGDTYLPMRVRRDEAVAIEHALKGVQNGWSTAAQDTLPRVIASLGGHVDRIVIQALASEGYYASVTLLQGEQQHRIDMRLGEALVLAIRSQAPLYATPEAMDHAGISLKLEETNSNMSARELPPPPEPITTSDKWRRPPIEHVWGFLVNTLYGTHTPPDLANLRDIAWEARFPAHELHWRDQTMQAVQLPTKEETWLILRPDLWEEIQRFVKWSQHLEMPSRLPSPQAVTLPTDLEKQLDAHLDAALNDLARAGARMIVLMHMSGKLIVWKSYDGFGNAARMGRAAVKDYLLHRYLMSLIGVEYTLGINVLFERNTDFNPTMAAGESITGTNERLINQHWMLVAGFSEDQWDEEAQQRFAQLEQELGQLLLHSS